MASTQRRDLVDRITDPEIVEYYNQLVGQLRSIPEFEKTAKEILKAVAYGALGTVAGGIIAGPIGASVGGVIGSGIGYAMSNDYESIISLLNKVPDEEKRNVAIKVQHIVGNRSVGALKRFIASKEHRTALMNVIRTAASKRYSRARDEEQIEGEDEVVEGGQEAVEGLQEFIEDTRESVEGFEDFVEGTQDAVGGLQEFVEHAHVGETQEAIEGLQEFVEGTQDAVRGFQNFVENTQDAVEGLQEFVEQGSDVVERLFEDAGQTLEVAEEENEEEN